MATQEQFNELQAVLQQQQRQVEELQAQLNAQSDAGRGLENQLAEEQRQRVQATNELTRATTALAEAQRGLREEREKAAAALSPGEQKLLTKPDRFASEKEKWKEWSKEFVSFLAAGNPQVREATALAASRRHGEPFSNAELALLGYTGVASVLYTVLENQTRGVANGLVEAAGGNGLEAWRLLVKEYDPDEAENEVDELISLLQPGAYSNDKLHKGVLDWEKGRGDYQTKYSEPACTARQAKAILISMTEGPLREHLRLHSSASSKTYADVRDTVLSYLRAKTNKGTKPTPARTTTGGGGYGSSGAGGPVPMEIDALAAKFAQLETRVLAALGKGGGKAGGKTPRGGATGGSSSSSGDGKKKLEPWEATEEEKLLTCDHCSQKGHTKRTCFQLHPHLKELRAKAAAKRASAKQEKKRLAALTDAPRGEDGAVVVDALAAAAAEPELDDDLAALAAEAEELLGPPPTLAKKNSDSSNDDDGEGSAPLLCAALPCASSDRPLPGAADVLAAVEAAAAEETRVLVPYLLGAALEQKEEQRAVDALRSVSFGSTETKTYLAAAAKHAKPKSKPYGAQPKGPAPAPPSSKGKGVLFDTAAGDSVLPRPLAERRTPLPGVRGPELENVSGDSIRSTGEVYSVDFVTGDKLLPGRLTAADVVQPVLSASHYSGPDGAFETLLRPPSTYRLKHLATGETFPLKWESGTLKLKEATCAAHEAKKVPAKLSTSAVTRVAAVPATKRSPGSGTKLSTPAAAKGGSEKEKTPRTKEKKEEKERGKQQARDRVQQLGSTAYKLSRNHLDALARALGVTKADRDGASKKELFRTVTGLSSAGGLRPGRPGREIP